MQNNNQRWGTINWWHVFHSQYIFYLYNLAIMVLGALMLRRLWNNRRPRGRHTRGKMLHSRAKEISALHQGISRARIWYLSPQFLRGFVVSANLRNTCWPSDNGKWQSPQFSAKLPQQLRRIMSKSWLTKLTTLHIRFSNEWVDRQDYGVLTSGRKCQMPPCRNERGLDKSWEILN